MVRARHRRALILRGTPAETASAAREVTVRLDGNAVLWVGGEEAHAISPRRVTRLLGRGFDAVVLNLHGGLDPDALAMCQGFVWGGGALLLRMPPRGALPEDGREGLVVHPFAASDVGRRFWTRFVRILEETGVESETMPEPLPPPPHVDQGTDEQEDLVRRLAESLASEGAAMFAVLADRGRGKSSALGLATARARASRPLRVAVTGASEAAVTEVLRFCGSPRPSYVPPSSLATTDDRYDVVLVDEAAQLPVPLLRRLVARHDTARIAFATTTRGYEGTGRGFVLRFLAELEASARPLSIERLTRPIRWSGGDPVEAFVYRALALDAMPARLGDDLEAGLVEEEIDHVVFDRDALADGEATLRELFGLLVHAHYRTTPSDLYRMLDAPNLRLHALVAGERVVAASLVALEGGLPPELRNALHRGSRRLRGHALPETLVCHSGEVEAGGFSFVRSVRIAVHPALRRRRLASILVEHVHRSYDPDFFGTMFGATPELLRFRRSVGYSLVRVGASRGVRTGEPAAVMLRAVSARAETVLARLRGVLARDLRVFIALREVDDELPLAPALVESLERGLPPPAPLTAADAERIAHAYADGPRTYETAACALEIVIGARPAAVRRLGDRERALVVGRIVHRRGWRRVAGDAGYETVPAAMRALRRAVAEILAAAVTEPPARP